MADEKGKGVLILIGVPIAVIVSLFAVIILLMPGAGSAAACTGSTGTVNPANIPANAVAGFSAGQLTNAAYIMNAAAAPGPARTGRPHGARSHRGHR